MEGQEIIIDLKQKKLTNLIEEYLKQPFTSLENLVFQNENLRSQTNMQILMRKLIHKFISVINNEMQKNNIIHQKNLIIIELKNKNEEFTNNVKIIDQQYSNEIQRLNNVLAEKEILLLNQVKI